jgi:DNA sulfur modification protein DndD
VERSWHRSGRALRERLELAQDGKSLPVDPSSFQSWLNDIVPPNLAALAFFDADQLNSHASTEDHAQAFASTLRRVLNLDLVERLISDLDQHLSRNGGPDRLARLCSAVPVVQGEIDTLTADLAEANAKIQVMRETELSIRAAIAREERRLAAEGGDYAARRPVLQDRLVVIDAEVQRLSNDLGEEVGQSLPFCLAPRLCATLAARLRQEADLQKRQLAGQLWTERLERLQHDVTQDQFWEGTQISAPDRYTVVKQLLRVLANGDDLAEQELLHPLAPQEREKVLDWLREAAEVVPERIQKLGEGLGALRDEQRQVAIELERAPDDDVLAPIHAALLRLETELHDLNVKQAIEREQIGSLQFRIEEKARQRDRITTELQAVQAASQRLTLADRSRLALRAYQDALTRTQLERLETVLAASFNGVCQKEHLVSSVSISPNDLTIELRSRGGEPIRLSDLSAGERQLYVFALLQALRAVSGRLLPLVIDTPVARLDPAHRHRFFQTYVPEVSQQVIVFATTAEIDADVLRDARPVLARHYDLSYDSTREATTVDELDSLGVVGTMSGGDCHAI